MFFDLNVKGNSYDNNLKLAEEASKYGWDHINFSYNQNKFANALEFKKDLQDNMFIGDDIMAKRITYPNIDIVAILNVKNKK